MPVHDWTRVNAGIFHHFHHEWISEISRALNRELYGTQYYALAEQIAGGLGPDVLTLQAPLPPLPSPPTAKRTTKAKRGGVLLAKKPPKMQYRIKNPPFWFASKKKSVTIRHVSEHRVVAVLEIVSPGNKAGRSALEAFVRKAQDLLSAGVHLDVIDLFPATPRDPEGIHRAVWGESDDGYEYDTAKPLTCASYIGGLGSEAFVGSLAVGDPLPNIPLFLTPLEYVDVPLEKTYASAFAAVPDVWRGTLSAGG